MSMSYLRTSEDAGAPVLVNTNGSFISLLDSVLVDGYGDKPALGWTKEFSGTNKAVYRNKGTKTYCRFDNSNTSYPSYVYFRAYESMQDIDKGLFPCPTYDESNSLILAGDSSLNNNPVPWRILGDDKGIWLYLRPYCARTLTNKYSLSGKIYYIGDYVPMDIKNTEYNFCFCWHNQYANSASYGSLSLNNDSYCYILRRPVNKKRSIGAKLTSLIYSDQIGNYSHSSYTHESDFIPLVPVYLSTGDSPPGIFGILPGCRNPLTRYGYNGASLTYENTEEKKPELLFDYGDYKEHFWRVVNTSYPVYIVLTEGRGFRDVF